MCQSVRVELCTERREVLQHEGREVTIFTEGEQVLLVQGVDIRFGVLLDDTVGYDDRATLVCCTDSVHGETTGQTCDRTEQTLEGLGQMMRDVVLVNLR